MLMVNCNTFQITWHTCYLVGTNSVGCVVSLLSCYLSIYHYYYYFKICLTELNKKKKLLRQIIQIVMPQALALLDWPCVF